LRTYHTDVTNKLAHNNAADALLTILTGGLSILLGGIPTSYETTITDKETGEQGKDYGHSKREAHDKAWRDLNKKR
jgi:hypothetical protein